MIDTHCHLTDPRLLEQLHDVFVRADTAGVTRMITISTSPADALDAIELCRGRERIRCTVGMHPNYVEADRLEEQLADLEQVPALQAHPTVIGLGEMGLDYHYSKEPRVRQAQWRIFERMLQIAVDLQRPIVIHCREAVDDTLAVLSGFSGVRGVFHCYTGTAAEAKRVLDAGYDIGFTGVLTFKNAEELRNVGRMVPSDRMLVETDAPWLSPEPVRRQKTNEPSFVMHTARMLAEIRRISLAELDRLTTANCQRLFGWGE